MYCPPAKPRIGRYRQHGIQVVADADGNLAWNALLYAELSNSLGVYKSKAAAMRALDEHEHLIGVVLAGTAGAVST